MPDAVTTPVEPESAPTPAAAAVAPATPNAVVEPKTSAPEATSDDVGDAGKAAIQKERELRADLARQLAEAKGLREQAEAKVKEFEDRDKTDQQRLTDEVETLRKSLADKDAEITKAQHASLRAEVAADKRVPASRLHGNTREELEADADAYLAEVAEAAARDTKKTPTKPPTPSTGLKSGASTTGDQSTDPKERAANALRSMRQAGG
ncbi:hypothetical protein [Nocardia aurea]|uniref:hypothetical protein n=1 Tax=Nocardia aurea TaxID=2144174 RepID=UPI0033B8BF1F